jgi:hypothetical protein
MKTTHRELNAIAAASALGSAVSSAQAAVPWYKRTYRWGQSSFRDSELGRADTAWWREQWRKTATQGVVIDAGGAVAYYPSKVPLHRQTQSIAGRDLFGEFSEAAHSDGLVVLAAVDSGSIGDDVLREHPEWVARTAAGEPLRTGAQLAPCVNSSYIEGYLHPIFQEVISRSQPAGIVGRNWEGLGRDAICYCENCAKGFRDKSGQGLPKSAAWDDSAYRDWIRWNYKRRLDIWDLNNRVTKAAGGVNCLWIGVIQASLLNQSAKFIDTREVATRSPFLLVDNLSRQAGGGGFWLNTEGGRYLNGLGNWGSVTVESAAMYQIGDTRFSRVSASPSEARLWMMSGIAGGFQPKYDHIGTTSLDKRTYRIAAPVMQWHKKYEAHLINRKPVATIGVVWSQSSSDFYGRDAAGTLSETPYRGILRALHHNRIPCIPIDITDVDREAKNLTAIILPSVGSMSEEQCASISRFVEQGGGLIATGVTSLYDGDGIARSDFGLASVLGTHLQGAAPDRMFASVAAAEPGGGRGRGPIPGAPGGGPGGRAFAAAIQSMLRLSPEIRATLSGPHKANEPHEPGPRHPALAGFEATDTLPFGGLLVPSFRVDPDRKVLCTFIPSFPSLPTDAAWMRTERTDIPGLIVGSYGKGKVAFMPADLDTRYGADPTPDHGRLLGNLARWVAGDSIPLSVEGTGTIGVYLYRQNSRLILHVVNEAGADNQRTPIDTYYPVGPFKISLVLPGSVKAGSVRLLASERPLQFTSGPNLTFEIPQVTDHEVVVIE